MRFHTSKKNLSTTIESTQPLSPFNKCEAKDQDSKSTCIKLTHGGEVTLSLPTSLESTAIEAMAKELFQAMEAQFCNPERWTIYSGYIEDTEKLKALVNKANHIERSVKSDMANKEASETQTEYLRRLKEESIKLFSNDFDTFYLEQYYELIDSSSRANLEEKLGEEGFENLRNDLVYLWESSDETSPLDVLSNHIEINYTPSFDYHNESVEDTEQRVLTTLDDDTFGKHDLNGIKTLLKLANVSSAKFAKYLDDECELPEESLRLISTLNVSAEGRAEVVDCKAIYTILTNANYGGIPAFTTFVDVKEFLLRDITKSVTIDKGSVGVEDYIYGSGHAELVDNPMIIPAGDSNWFSPTKWESRDSVYGYYIPAMKGHLRQLTVQ